MNVYAESSPVLAWLLGQEEGQRVREVFGRSELVAGLGSDAHRVRSRFDPAVELGAIDEAKAADRRAHLNTAAAHWHLWRVSADIADRARRPFPREPVRAPDAVHLASALAVRPVAQAWNF